MIVVVDYIGAVVEAMRAQLSNTPYYLYGHRVEINTRLLDKPQRVDEKYPLVALRLDIPERVSSLGMEVELNIAIMTYTNESYTAKQRYDNVFRPILYPLYEDFISQLRISGKFSWQNFHEPPPHTKIDRPFWGTQNSEGNTANFFSDPLDAIEIINLKITALHNC